MMDKIPILMKKEYYFNGDNVEYRILYVKYEGVDLSYDFT